MNEKKKRVAVLGGGAHTIPNYRAMLKLLAHDFDLFLFSEFHLDKESAVSEYQIFSVSKIKGSRRWRELLFFLIVVKSCFTKKINLIHSHSTYPSGLVAVIVGKLFRIPVLVCLDAAEGTGIANIKFGDLLNPRRKKVNQWVLRKATAVTALTKFQENEIRFNLEYSGKIHIIPRGVDTTKYFSKEIKSIVKPIRFLNVAYIHPVKDQETLLRAFQIIHQEINSTLTIVGQDYENGRLKRMAIDLNIDEHVNFVGFIPNEAISSYYHNSDILLHTSLYESMAAAVLEAMASGVLVCGTHVGIMADLSDKCCLTVSPTDFHLLAKKVIELVHSPELQEKYRAGAFEWVRKHSLTWSTNQHKLLYDELMVHH